MEASARAGATVDLSIGLFDNTKASCSLSSLATDNVVSTAVSCGQL